MILKAAGVMMFIWIIQVTEFTGKRTKHYWKQVPRSSEDLKKHDKNTSERLPDEALYTYNLGKREWMESSTLW